MPVGNAKPWPSDLKSNELIYITSKSKSLAVYENVLVVPSVMLSKNYRRLLLYTPGPSLEKFPTLSNKGLVVPQIYNVTRTVVDESSQNPLSYDRRVWRCLCIVALESSESYQLVRRPW
jgi:hypothetical protein